MINTPLYTRGSIYLSGGMQFAKDLGAGWRIDCSIRLKQMGYFPIDITQMDKAYTAKYGQLYYILDPSKHLEYKSNFRRHFIHADSQLVIRDSDALIVLYDESVRRGAGTISECQIAYDNDIPIFLVSTYEDWQKEVPGWLQGLTTKIFTEFDTMYEYLHNLPFGILKRDVYGNHSAGNCYLCSLCGSVFGKEKHHFVSKISPLYCKSCVDLVTKTHESHADRYAFIIAQLDEDSETELNNLASPFVSNKSKLEKMFTIDELEQAYKNMQKAITEEKV
jgi:hypothetical protein